MTDETSPNSFRDWTADFAGSPKTDDELAAWHAKLAGEANDEIRQLVAEAQCMRWAARVLLQRARDGGALPLRDGQIDEPLRIAEWLLDVRDPQRQRSAG